MQSTPRARCSIYNSVIPQQLLKYFCSAHRIKAENVLCLNPLCWHAELQSWELVLSPNIFRVQLKSSRTAKCLNECALLFHTNRWNNIVTVTNGPFNTHTLMYCVCVFALMLSDLLWVQLSALLFILSPAAMLELRGVPVSWDPGLFQATHSNSHTVTHWDTHTVFMLTVSPSSWWSVKIITVSPFQHIFQTSIFTAQRLQDVFSESPAV